MTQTLTLAALIFSPSKRKAAFEAMTATQIEVRLIADAAFKLGQEDNENYWRGYVNGWTARDAAGISGQPVPAPRQGAPV